MTGSSNFLWLSVPVALKQASSPRCSPSLTLTLYNQYTPFTMPAGKRPALPWWEIGFDRLTSCSHPGVRPTSSLSSPTPVRGLCPVRFSTSYSAYSLLSSTHLWGPSVFSFLIAACSDSACFPNPSCPLRARPAPPPGSLPS